MRHKRRKRFRVKRAKLTRPTGVREFSQTPTPNLSLLVQKASRFHTEQLSFTLSKG